MMLSQQMTDEKFFEIMAQVYNIKLDEADEWDFINAAREDRALVMNDRSQLDALKAENARLTKALIAAKAVTDRPMHPGISCGAKISVLIREQGEIQQIINEALQPEAE